MSLKKWTMLSVFTGLIVAVASCAPAATPTPTPIPKAPTTAPATPAAPAKTAEPAKPAAAAPTPSPKPAPAAPTPTPRPASIKFGSIQSAAFAAVYLTIDKGYFKEQGIDVEVIDFRTIQEVIAPLGTGQLDVTALPLSTPLMAAADRGIDLKMVAAASSTTSKFQHNWLMLRKDLKDSGQVKTAADLKGMKVAIPSQGSIGEQTVQLMLEQGGLKPGEAEVIVVPLTEQAPAFANKAIAASYTMEPQVARIIQEGFADKWMPVGSFYGGQAQTSVVVFGGTLLKDQDLARRWMIAYVKGIRDYLKAVTTKQGFDEVVKAVSKYTPVKDPKTYELMELPYVDPNGALDKKSVEAQFKWWVEKGLYTGKKTIEDITDLSYVDYAAQKLGKQ